MFLNAFHSAGWESFIGFKCAYCESNLTVDNLSKDHVIPKSCSVNFGDLSNNTIACCKACNHDKGDKSLLNFMGLLEETIKTKKKADWSIDEKCIYLGDICGLKVKTRKYKGNTEYIFYIDNQQTKSCFTYPKAKLFAEGFKLGKEYAKS
jgi:hypothetical protein